MPFCTYRSNPSIKVKCVFSKTKGDCPLTRERARVRAHLCPSTYTNTHQLLRSSPVELGSTHVVLGEVVCDPGVLPEVSVAGAEAVDEHRADRSTLKNRHVVLTCRHISSVSTARNATGKTPEHIHVCELELTDGELGSIVIDVQHCEFHGRGCVVDDRRSMTRNQVTRDHLKNVLYI